MHVFKQKLMEYSFYLDVMQVTKHACHILLFLTRFWCMQGILNWYWWRSINVPRKRHCSSRSGKGGIRSSGWSNHKPGVWKMSRDLSCLNFTLVCCVIVGHNFPRKMPYWDRDLTPHYHSLSEVILYRQYGWSFTSMRNSSDSFNKDVCWMRKNITHEPGAAYSHELTAANYISIGRLCVTI